MTFKELKNWLDCLTPTQLEASVMCYSSVIDEATPVSLRFNTKEHMGETLEDVAQGSPLLVLVE